MKRLFIIVALAFSLQTTIASHTYAVGISVDAGLTPGEDRWILRTQLKYMQHGDDPTQMDREMEMYAVPVVLAYGLRSDLTVMARQAVMWERMSMPGGSSEDTGLGDFVLLAKYRALRINTPDYILGIAPTIGVEFPSGEKPFTSQTWDLAVGLYASLWKNALGVDFNVKYKVNGIEHQTADDTDPGEELSLDMALAYQFSVGRDMRSSIIPVLEFSYINIAQDNMDGTNVPDTGETVFYFSSGVKYATSSVILEALLQIPVSQSQKGSQLEKDTGGLMGIRFLF